MADLSTNLAGIKSPNPFWIASGPPANTAYQAHRAFEAGWGGVVWKTIGDPIRNVSSRYSSIDYGNMRMAGLNNIELISDRSPETNFREIAEVKKALAAPCRHRLAHGRHARELARLRPALGRLRGGRDRAEFRLSPWHVRTRDGLGRWPKSRCCRDDHRLGDGSRDHSRDRETDAQHHRHLPPPPAPRNAAARTPSRSSTRSTASPRSTSTTSCPSHSWRAQLAWRLLRAGRETDRAQHGPILRR